MVRAKFKVTSKTSHMSSVINSDTSDGAPRYIEKEVGTVKLTAVHGEENKEWSVWTPSGEVSMTINNPDAYKQFELGGAYYIDFTLIK